MMTPGTRSSPPKTIMEPKLNPSLEDDFPIERVAFCRFHVSFLGGGYIRISIHIYTQFIHNVYAATGIRQMFQVDWNAKKMKVCFTVYMVVYIV